MPTHQRVGGKMVSIVRTAKSGDNGYDDVVNKYKKSAEDQRASVNPARAADQRPAPAPQIYPDDFVLVKTEDGSETVVHRSEITDS